MVEQPKSLSEKIADIANPPPFESFQSQQCIVYLIESYSAISDYYQQYYKHAYDKSAFDADTLNLCHALKLQNKVQSGDWLTLIRGLHTLLQRLKLYIENKQNEQNNPQYHQYLSQFWSVTHHQSNAPTQHLSPQATNIQNNTRQELSKTYIQEARGGVSEEKDTESADIKNWDELCESFKKIPVNGINNYSDLGTLISTMHQESVQGQGELIKNIGKKTFSEIANLSQITDQQSRFLESVGIDGLFDDMQTVYRRLKQYFLSNQSPANQQATASTGTNHQTPQKTDKSSAHRDLEYYLQNHNYEILEQIGQGGMGAVFLVINKTLNRKSAMKMILPGSVNSETLKRFKQEAQLTAQLDHSNIIRVYNYIDIDEAGILEMEYFPSMDLYDYMKQNGPLPVDQALEIMRNVTQALGEAHKNGVIHRDIKPSNIFINKKGEVKLGDFGIAGTIELQTQEDIIPLGSKVFNNTAPKALTTCGSVIGSLDYMPPEQARSEMDKIKPASDFFALGATFYHLLTGQKPFGEQDKGQNEFLLRRDEYKTPLPHIFPTDLEATPQQKKLDAIIRKCTNPKIRKRYKTAQELIEDIESAQQNDLLHWANTVSQYTGISIKLVIVLLISIMTKLSIETINSVSAANKTPQELPAYVELEPKKQSIQELYVDGKKIDFTQHFLLASEGTNEAEQADMMTSIHHVMVYKKHLSHFVVTYQIFKNHNDSYRVCKIVSQTHKGAQQHSESTQNESFTFDVENLKAARIALQAMTSEDKAAIEKDEDADVITSTGVTVE